MRKTLSLLIALALLLTLVAVSAVAEGKTIVYWSMWEATEPQGKVLQEAINAYMEKTGNKVDVQFKGRTGILTWKRWPRPRTTTRPPSAA